MREEMERGASLRMAIRNGFARATGTILDSNITTLITAVVLYVIGTDQIKGFAVTLILGLLVSMFTAIVVSRLIFDVAEKQRWITKLTMMKFVGETHFNFIRYCLPAVCFSAVIMAAGLVAMFSRGKELLDIDFTGGSSVQVVFAEDKPQDIGNVRIGVADLEDVAVSSVGEDRREFKVDTSDKDIKHVQAVLKEKFGDSLKTYQMSFGALSKIEAPAAAATPEAATPEAAPAKAPPAGDAKPADASTESPAAAAPPAAEAPVEKPAETAPAAETPAASEAPAETPPASEAPQDEQSLSARPNPFRFATYLQEPKAEEQPAETAPAENAPADSAAATEAPKTDTPAAEVPAAPPATETPAAAAPDAPRRNEVSADDSLAGGTRVELEFPEEIAHDPLADLVQQQLDAHKFADISFRLSNPAYQEGSDARYQKWTLESTLDEAQTKQLLDGMQSTLATTPVFPSSSEIGGKVAGDTQLMAVYAMLASMAMIVLYVWIRFQNLYFGLAAVVALVHDVMIAVAALALSAYLSPYMASLLVDPFKISLPVVAALLTIVGFSINDTIVIFDRIREVRGKSPHLTADMINLSVNQTLSRTILTSGTVFIACVILYFFGGPGIHAFAFTMVIGVIAGTYSTVYIAAPLLLWLRPTKDREAAPKQPLATAGPRGR
jgi:SecD/SecF fusion protein